MTTAPTQRVLTPHARPSSMDALAPLPRRVKNPQRARASRAAQVDEQIDGFVGGPAPRPIVPSRGHGPCRATRTATGGCGGWEGIKIPGSGAEIILPAGAAPRVFPRQDEEFVAIDNSTKERRNGERARPGIRRRARAFGSGSVVEATGEQRDDARFETLESFYDILDNEVSRG